MAAKRNTIIKTLAVIVPVIIITCVLIVIFVIVPNAQNGEVIVISLSSANQTQDIEGQVTTHNNQLFVVGLIFASGLFVFLLVAIIIAFILAKQARGYAIGNENQEGNFAGIAKNEFCELTDHKSGCSSDQVNVRGKTTTDAAKRHSSPVILSERTQNLKDSNFSQSPNSESPQVSGCITKARPQSYGTLSRTRLMSSVDEDGYYIDKFDYNLDETTTQTDESDGNVIDEDVHSILTNLEEDLKDDTEIDKNKTPLKRQLTKQDTFESLPPLKSFDNYLTLVRIDSTSSFDTVLEQTRLPEKNPEENPEATENKDKEKLGEE